MDNQIFLPVLDLAFRGKPETLAAERNIAELMSHDDRQKIGKWALEGYQQDKTSRSKWEEWYAEAIKLALQVKEGKTFPWPGCSNVKFPLLTVAALNAHAQAYPALISGDNVVKSRILGEDPDGSKTARANRVGRHMSFQLLETMPWEEQTDKQILVHYIMGTTFKKTYRDNTRRQNVSELVMPQDLIVNYFSKDMESCPRASHWIPMSKNEVVENINAQVFLHPDETIRTENRPTGPLEAAQDKSQLTSPPPNLNLVTYLIEQSCWMDLDQDGYDEPYAITFDEQTGFVYRIHARYLVRDIKRGSKNQVVRIDPENYYTKFILFPSPDGGFYGMGLGRFLAPINDAIDTIINQMIDSNTMSILGGGFLGRGVRIKMGESQFKPYEWKPVDSTGDDLRKNIFPQPVREVTAVAFQLLQYLVEYGERIASASEIQVGKLPGQNVKAETAHIANENGKLIFNATYKRFWRSLKEEFKKIAALNYIYQDDESFTIGGKNFEIKKEDYALANLSGIIPAADPNIVSRTDRRMAADMVLQTAASLGWAGHDMEAVIKRRYQAYEIPDIEVIFPGIEAKPPQPNPKQIEAQIKAQREQTRRMDVQQKNQMAAGKLMLQAKESNAKILKMMAEVAKIMKEAEGIDVGHQIALLQLQIDAEVEHRDDVIEIINMLLESIKDTNDAQPNAGGMDGMDSPPGNKAASQVPATA